MLLQLSGERTIPASRQAVWVALNDPATLCRCLPSCGSIERVSDVEFTLVASPVTGPGGTLSLGTIRLDDVDPPSGYRFKAELRDQAGEEAATVAGRVELKAEGQATRLRYQANVGIGEKLMRAGPAPGEAAVRALTEDVLVRLGQAVAEAQPAAVAYPPAARPADEARPGLRPSIWVPALMLAVALILFAAWR